MSEPSAADRIPAGAPLSAVIRIGSHPTDTRHLRPLRWMLTSAVVLATLAGPVCQITAVADESVSDASRASAGNSDETAGVATPGTADTSTTFATGHYTGPLLIPPIARFDSLPVRMLLEPEFEIPAVVSIVDPGHLPLFDRVLRDSSDTELQTQAAAGLARFARESLGDISGSADILQQSLKLHQDPGVRHYCAMALAAAQITSAAELLLEYGRTGDDHARLAVEPTLAEWKYQPAAQIWKQRLTDRFATSVSVRLACEGLIALGDQDALQPLQALATSPAASFAHRFAACRALGQLHPQEARALARTSAAAVIHDRLLAVPLLANTEPESVKLLLILCQDSNQGVAASAWTAVAKNDPAALVDLLDHGRQHSDAGVRMTSANIMRQFPSARHCEWLNVMLGDTHLEVRNTARVQLVQVAEADAALQSQIIATSADNLTKDAAAWQRLEQSLLILGQLRAAEYSERLLPLVDHPRNEVAVSAAWLIHLYPDAALNDRVLEMIARKDDLLHQYPMPPETPAASSIHLQVAHLFQFAGLQRLESLLPRLEKSFSKGEPGGINKRAAAVWSIGLIRENSNDTSLAKKFESRVKDRDGMMPEQPLVRQMAVRALGMIRAVASVDVVQDAYELDPPAALIPQAARWVMPLLGQPELPELPATENRAGGFRLNPVVPTGAGE